MCVLIEPSLFWRVASAFFGIKLFEGLKHLQVLFYIRNIWVQILKGLVKGPTRRTKGWLRHCLSIFNRWTKWHPGYWLTDRWWVIVYVNLSLETLNQRTAKEQSTEAIDVPLIDLLSIDGGLQLVSCALFHWRGEWKIHTKFSNYSNRFIYILFGVYR